MVKSGRKIANPNTKQILENAGICKLLQQKGAEKPAFFW